MRILELRRYSFIFLLPIILASCLQYEEVELKSFDGVMLKGISSQNIEIEASATILNPNDYNIKIKDPNIDVYLEGHKIGKLDLDETLVLEKNSKKTYTIPIRTSLDTELGSILPLMFTVFTKDKVLMQAKGDFKASAKMLSKRVDVDIEQEVDLRR